MSIQVIKGVDKINIAGHCLHSFVLKVRDLLDQGYVFGDRFVDQCQEPLASYYEAVLYVEGKQPKKYVEPSEQEAPSEKEDTPKEDPAPEEHDIPKDDTISVAEDAPVIDDSDLESARDSIMEGVSTGEEEDLKQEEPRMSLEEFEKYVTSEKKKQRMLDIAKDVGMSIPSSIKAPAAMAKWLVDNYQP